MKHFITRKVDSRVRDRKPGEILKLQAYLNPKLEKDKYSVQEAMKLLGLKESTVQIYCTKGYLKAKKTGKQWEISRNSLQEAMRRTRTVIPLIEAVKLLKEAGFKISLTALTAMAKDRNLLKRGVTKNKGIPFVELYRIKYELQREQYSVGLKEAGKLLGTEGYTNQLIDRGLIKAVKIRGFWRIPNYELARIRKQQKREVLLYDARIEVLDSGLTNLSEAVIARRLRQSGIINKGVLGREIIYRADLDSFKRSLENIKNERSATQKRRALEKTRAREEAERRERERKARERTRKKELLEGLNIGPSEPRYDYILDEVSIARIKRSQRLAEQLAGTTNLSGFSDYVGRSENYFRQNAQKLKRGIQKRDALVEANEAAQRATVNTRVIEKAMDRKRLSRREIVNLIILCKQGNSRAFDAMVVQWLQKIKKEVRGVPQRFYSIPFETREHFGILGLRRAINSYNRLDPKNYAFSGYASKAIRGEIRDRCAEEIGLRRDGTKEVSIEDLSHSLQQKYK